MVRRWVSIPLHAVPGLCSTSSGSAVQFNCYTARHRDDGRTSCIRLRRVGLGDRVAHLLRVANLSHVGVLPEVESFLTDRVWTSAKILARFIISDPSIRTYADIGRKAFGNKCTPFISLLFCLELFTVCVGLVTLYGDSLGESFFSLSLIFG